MRALTDSEARVIAVMLAAMPDKERERLKRMDLPRSTYHAARRRAYDEGWLRDRYVPDPSRFGLPRATFLLARPYVDRIRELTDAWQSVPSNVVLWASTQMALGVFFLPNALAEESLVSKLNAKRLSSWQITLGAELTEPSVPVYFDYEGLWAHLSDLSGTVAYPHGLGGVAEDDGSAHPSSHTVGGWALGELINRPFYSASQGRAGHLIGPFGLPFSQQRLLVKGWVTHRVFLEPSRLPSYKGRAADQVFLVTGELRTGVRPENLFATLTRDCRVFPFLYVVGSGRLLLGALGAAGGSAGPATDRRPVMATLQESVQGIEIVQDAATNLSMYVDHRYDRLFPKKSSS